MSLLVEHAKIVGMINPIDTTGAAATAKYVSMKNYNHLTIIIQSGAWAGGTAAITLSQATDVSATGAKALGFSYQWTGTAASGLLTKTAVTSNTFNVSVANTLHVIEVDANTLDVANGFDCVTLAQASPGANADLISAVYILSEPKYAAATPPSAIVD